MIRAAPLVLALTGMLASTLTATQALAATSTESALAISDALEKAGFEGGFAVVSQNGDLTIVPSKGNEANTPLPWASVTKQVIAVLAMQLVEDGTLALDVPADAYLVSLAGDSPAPTIRQMLQHQTGLKNPDNSPEDASGIPDFYTTGPSGLSWCLADRGSTPAEGWEYNNCDFIVLGAVIEAATGERLDSLLEARIFAPAGMASTRIASGMGSDTRVEGGAAIAQRAARYGASAGLIGPFAELLAFDRALMNGDLLSEEARSVLWDGSPALGYMALGQWSFPANLSGCAAPVSLVERRGAIADFHIQNYIVPDRGIALAAITRQAEFDFGEIWTGQGAIFETLSAWLCPAQNKKDIALVR
ncbi:MAG: serine hydrolase domain-containing protein [Pseudomonadota bacterium]